MNDPGVFVTVNVHPDTPIDLNVGERTAVLTLGEAENVALEFASVHALEQFQEHISAGLATMHAQLAADPEGDDGLTAGGGR